MTPEEFDGRLRTLIRQRPFQPFTVVLRTGERIEADVPEAVAFNAGAAGHVSASGEITFFASEDVSQIETTVAEKAS